MKSKNSRAAAPIGSVKTFAKKFANIATKFQSLTKLYMIKLIAEISKLPINAAPTANAPVTTPIPDSATSVVFAIQLQSANKVAISITIAKTINVIGQANKAALKPYCETVAAKVALLCNINDALCIEVARAAKSCNLL